MKYPRNNGYTPGSWKPLVNAGRMSASFACPVCQKIALLFEYQIGRYGIGIVTPEFICPNGCGFHDNLALEGWFYN